MVDIYPALTYHRGGAGTIEGYILRNGGPAPDCAGCILTLKGERNGMKCNGMGERNYAILSLETDRIDDGTPTVNELLQDLVSEGQAVPCIEP